MKRAVIFGAAGFIGSHLLSRLKAEGYHVSGVDIRPPGPNAAIADTFTTGDLRNPRVVEQALDGAVDELYQLAANMGGAGYIYSGDTDADVMHDSALINLHAAEIASRRGVARLFYSSSACVYAKQHQQDPDAPVCSEDAAYPAEPDSEYGWEKLFAERVYDAFRRNRGLDVRVARFHNVYGPGNPWRGGREKAPAALCRKVFEAGRNGVVEIWGDGRQTRSFLYIDDCIGGVRALMASSCTSPVNIGSEELISIDGLARLIMGIAGSEATLRHVAGPIGVRGRVSDNRQVSAETGWRPVVGLAEGLAHTYAWVAAEAAASRSTAPSALVS
jgi:GDP-D-mannose 3', 5'-epimerase